MTDNENKWRTDYGDDDNRDAPGNAGDVEVPASLAPTVLHRLGLTPEQAYSEISVDDLMARLKSEDWTVRIVAVRTLGRLDIGAPVELLASALDDEDESVRAAAVHALGNAGVRAPLHRLVEALSDSDWHVRETAALALGKQGQRIPDEVLETALHDTDHLVKEAAQLALQLKAAEERSNAAYGRLWEQKSMQHDEYHGYNGYKGQDTPLSNGNGNATSFETVPSWESAAAYNASAGQSQVMREQAQDYETQQMQEYASQEREQPSYEYSGATSSRWEKVTSLPQPRKRRSHAGRWIAIGVLVLILFTAGGAIGKTVARSGSSSGAFPGPFPPNVKMQMDRAFPFLDPQYNWIAQNDIAQGLHLTPDQVRAQISNGSSMTDIAEAQNVPPDVLQNVELNAFQDLLNSEVKAGAIGQDEAGQWMQRLQNNPQLLDKLTMTLFSFNVNKKP
jgi:hypothetical protein